MVADASFVFQGEGLGVSLRKFKKIQVDSRQHRKIQ